MNIHIHTCVYIYMYIYAYICRFKKEGHSDVVYSRQNNVKAAHAVFDIGSAI